MSKIAHESQDDDHITVSKIYETLKSGPYLKSLYWDVLSDLKEKDTFKKMRRTTEKLLNKKCEDIANLPDNEAGNLQRKTIVTEICSMSYAIDTVYSKILFIKLQKEFKKHIIDAIGDLREEKKIPDSVWSKLQISDDLEIKSPAENSAAKNSSPQQKPEVSCRPKRKKRQKITSVELATKNREIRSEIHEDLKAINSDESKLSMSKKSTNAGSQVKKKATSLSVKGRPKKKQAEENQISSKLKTATKTVEDRDIPKENTQFDNLGSDAESVGNVSLASVSSVHTSDLSSFDDEISLSSEDGENGERRKFSLKELKEMSNSGIFSSKFNGLLLKNLAEKERLKEKPSAQKDKQTERLGKADSTVDSTDSSAEAQSPSQKTLPKRIRKPNSKYSSDSIVCTIKKVKVRKKPSVEVQDNAKTSSNENNSQNTQTSSDLKVSSDSKQASKKRLKSDASDSEAEAATKIMKTVQVKEENDSESDLPDSSTPSQSALEVYKPHFAVHSLTSRKTEPVTLYST